MHSAVAPGTVRTEGASSGSAEGQGATQTTACGVSARRAERAAQLRHRHVPLPVPLGGQHRPQLPAQVRAVLCLVGEQRADPRRDLHGRRQLPFGRARIGVQEPHVAEDHTPMAYRQAGAPAVHPRLGVGGMRTGPVARAMPELLNHARTAAVERRVRIERVRTGSRAEGSRSPSLS
ncbi:hypothetical protein SVIOM342S_07453 [Streptomyces violaceorubidus]